MIDFRNFCKIDAVNVSNFRRVISSFTLYRQQEEGKGEKIEEEREMWYFQIEGQAFLWHQVRCMVALLFLIGKKREEVSIIKTMLSVESTPEQAIPLCPRKPQVIVFICCFCFFDI